MADESQIPPFKLALGSVAPYDSAISSMFEYIKVVRETTDPALRNRIDAIAVEFFEDLHYVCRKFWRDVGVLPPTNRS